MTSGDAAWRSSARHFGATGRATGRRAKARQRRPKWISSVIVGSQGLRIQDDSGRAKGLEA
jgi:hypothetical protein